MLNRLALLCLGLMAGFFFAYSVTVMPGLDDASNLVAIEAMQGINRVVRNPVFFACFFGGAALPIAASALSLFQGKRISAAFMGAAGVVYVVGVIILTAQINVPMNDALAVVQTPAAPGIWPTYSVDWTFWNHVRGLFCLACLGLSAEALRHS